MNGQLVGNMYTKKKHLSICYDKHTFLYPFIALKTNTDTFKILPIHTYPSNKKELKCKYELAHTYWCPKNHYEIVQ